MDVPERVVDVRRAPRRCAGGNSMCVRVDVVSQAGRPVSASRLFPTAVADRPTNRHSRPLAAADR